MSNTDFKSFWQRYGTLYPLKSDASLRKYFRLKTESASYIIADCALDPKLIDQCRMQHDLFYSHHLPIPLIDLWHTDTHSYRSADLGQIHLIDQLDDTPKVFDIIQQLQSTTLPQTLPSPMNKQAENQKIFETFYMQSSSKNAQIKYATCAKKVWGWLNTHIDLIPTSWCHGDLHSENIMIHDNKLYMIDYQDSYLGPVTLDYVSLIDDVRIEWNPFLREKYIEQITQHLANEHHMPEHDMHHYLEATTIARLLRIIGIFCRLSILDQKHQYLQYIPKIKIMIQHISSDIPSLSKNLKWLQA